MHSVRTRLNVVVSMYIATMGLCALLMFITGLAETYFHPPHPTAQFNVLLSQLVPVEVGQPQHGNRRGIDRTVLYINGTADLSSAFTWNTKQLYVWFAAEYKTPNYKRNEITLYDTIVSNKEEAAHLTFTNAAEYYLDDIGQGTLAGRKVVVRLKYHVMSFSGWSPKYEVPKTSVSLSLPTGYSRGK